MKKFWVFSDLHLEVDNTIPLPIEAENADAIIIAGDLTHASKISVKARELIQYYGLRSFSWQGITSFISSSLIDKQFMTSVLLQRNPLLRIGGNHFIS